MVHILLQKKKRVTKRKRKNVCFFQKICRQILTSQKRNGVANSLKSFHLLHNGVDSRPWLSFSYSLCERSRPIYENRFRRKSPTSMELVAVTRTRFLGESFSRDSEYSKPAKKWRRRFFLVPEQKRWILAALSYQTWVALNSSGEIRSWRWMLS